MKETNRGIDNFQFLFRIVVITYDWRITNSFFDSDLVVFAANKKCAITRRLYCSMSAQCLLRKKIKKNGVCALRYWYFAFRSSQYWKRCTLGTMQYFETTCFVTGKNFIYNFLLLLLTAILDSKCTWMFLPSQQTFLSFFIFIS